MPSTGPTTAHRALSGLLPGEIAAELGLQPFQARQIFRWIHQKQVFDFDAMTDLSKDLRARLASGYTAMGLRPLDVSVSGRSMGTRKVLCALPDGETVESVLIRERERITLCLSSQVGCAVKCAFCATGLSGYTRNLGAGEIVEQALYLLAGEDLAGRHPNIVYMGMGEPLRNYDAVVRSVRLLMAKQGLNIGQRRITVSTVGEVEGIRRFAREDWQVRLSISLHAANDALRDRLVPINRKYPLAMLLAAIDEYLAATGRQVTFEYTLLRGVNDSLDDAADLAALALPRKAAVNLIPYNPVAGTEFAPPSPRHCEAFRDRVARSGVATTLRKERGQDIDAACGQLRRRQLAGG